jgi:arginine/lysine/ornithine decarboxylase
VYVDPYYDEELEIAHGVIAEDLARTLDEHPEAKAAIVFTPTYYGTSTDVKALADVCHERDLPLVTDDAWALDHAFGHHPEFPPSALSRGSDLAIGSVHKTLTGLSQTSVLSVGSDRIDAERLQLCFELEESTSTSGLLLSSIDGARAQFVREGTQLLDRAVRTAQLLRDRLAAEVPELRVIDPAALRRRPSVDAVDPTHVLIETASISLTGYQAVDWLRLERHVDIELVDHRRIMPLVTFAHDRDDVERFVGALRDLVSARGSHNGGAVPSLPSRRQIRSEAAMTPRDAFFAPAEPVPAEEAEGRISAELVTPYPPGIPAVAPGERYNRDNIAYLQEVVRAGGFVEGATDPTLSKLRVVAG